MKKKLLLMITFLCVFNTYPQKKLIPETFEKSFVRKKSRTIRVAKIEDKKLQNIAAGNFDSDGDGILDNIDIDDDNDGITDVDEEFYCRRSPFAILGTPCDTDNDGVPDVFDLDSDNDGIPDIVEAGLGHLSNGTDRIAVTWVDNSNNGMHDASETNTPVNTDLDGVPNYLDLDSDNDSLFDVDESGAGNTNAFAGFVNGDGDSNGDGVGDGLDSETFDDGILDIFDYFEGVDFATSYGNNKQGSGPLFVKDTDGDSTPDYMDIKSNGTTFDISGTLYAYLDANNDGLIDGTADVDRDGILDAFDTNTSVYGSPRDLNRKLHLYFDGRNDYIEEDSGTNIVNGLSQVTMMAWIKLDPSFSGDGAIMGQKNLWMRINTSKRLRVEIQDYYSLSASAPTTLTLNKWVHVAVVYNGANTSETLKLFINGERVAFRNDLAIQGGIKSDANNKFRIGRTPTSESLSTGEMFKGEMDEVRVFNKALTDDELRKIVYQEIEENSGNVRGAIIPRDIANFVNAATTPAVLPWANLVRYYRMDVFKDDIVDNLTTPAIDVGSGAKMYNFKNMYPQTAPLPYETKADGDWSNTAIWLNGSVWDIASEATNKDWAIVHIKNNVTTSNRHSTAGLIIDSAKKLSIKTSKELKNTWYLELDGVIDLEDESQLVQTAESILDQDSGGFIERDQQGTANSYNYNYWSSSVGPISGTSARGTGTASTNASHKLVDILMDGTIAAEPNKKGVINFQPAHWSADNGVTSPIMISSYWLYTFNGTANNYGAWKTINQNTPIQTGEGYTMKGTSGAVNIGNQQNYVFKGKPNNGDFTLPILKGHNRLIGNPYPSAMDADEFIKDNIKETINSKTGRNTKNIFNGALYFWDHFGERNSHYLKEYVGGYATYTLMGGVKSISNDTRINTTSGLLSSKKPQKYIPVNQGFFVIAALELNPAATYTTPTIDGSDIVFKNSQRVFMVESEENSVFMKGDLAKSGYTSMEKVKDSIGNMDKRPKIWLQFDSPTGYQRQLLVGVDENASNFFDLGYDAPLADIGKEDMFWTFEGGKFVIQAVNNFNTDQDLPLDIKVSKTGLSRIKIDELTNMDENISVYINDKLTGILHNISHKPFEINLEAGTYADRFSLTFKMHKLIEEDVNVEIFLEATLPPIIEGIYVVMDNTIGELQIKNNSTEEITGITLYNYLGQIMKTWNANFNRRTISLPINIATGVYFVRISTKNNLIVKKIMKL
ncbi:MAG TPA: LamG-like jellyroll fold domain-containing protein [Lutibacter sp.]|nr:LamG-like jellyroll fold domain-containing protein [Lutibacter sp.]